MKFLILGAGPAGLTFANYLKQQGETSFLVLEKEAEAGGLCRSKIIGGSPLDIGGGHFLDVKNKEATDFLFQFMPREEWNHFNRNSQICIHDTFINSPIEANIWQLSVEMQIEYLKSIAIAGCNLQTPKPEKFIDWIFWKLGEKIAKEYMIPYNEKMFSKNLHELGSYWLEKLPNVSFEQTLLSCLERKPYGTQPGHAEFFYPKFYGYGELWLRMADNIKDNIQYGIEISEINFESKKINHNFKADYVISTIPWNSFSVLAGMPDILQAKINKLMHNGILVNYVNATMDTDAHWIYYPDRYLSYHRILVRQNFCQNSRGYWTETNLERMTETENDNNFINDYAYPLNTIEKPSIMKELHDWTTKYNVYGLGRWGEHQHYNSDITVNLAIKLARTILKKL